MYGYILQGNLPSGSPTGYVALKKAEGWLILARNIHSFPPDVAKEIKRHKARQAEEHMKARVKAAKHAKKFNVEIDPETYWVESGLVFRQDNGDRLDPRSYYKTYQLLLNDKAKMSGFRFHDLRHTYATLMIKKGVHVKVVSEALGHASIQITLDTYAHVLPGMMEQAAMTLQGVFTEEASEADSEDK